MLHDFDQLALNQVHNTNDSYQRELSVPRHSARPSRTGLLPESERPRDNHSLEGTRDAQRLSPRSPETSEASDVDLLGASPAGCGLSVVIWSVLTSLVSISACRLDAAAPTDPSGHTRHERSSFSLTQCRPHV
jgi:hypothetical protein